MARSQRTTSSSAGVSKASSQSSAELDEHSVSNASMVEQLRSGSLDDSESAGWGGGKWQLLGQTFGTLQALHDLQACLYPLSLRLQGWR